MSKFYLSSNNIKIFPLGTNRSTYDPYGRVLNEQNISQIVKSIVDKPSYVIEYDSDKHKIKFVINGYYCDCNIGKQTGSLYAGISMATYNNSYEYVSGADDTDDIFQGVVFGTKKSDLEATHTLQLLDDSGKVPAESYLKFNNRSISGISSYKVINCGSSKDIF